MIKKNNQNESICELFIDNQLYTFRVNGTFFLGKPEILYNQNKSSVIRNSDWENEGYKIIEAFDSETFKKLLNSVKKQVLIGIEKAIGKTIGLNNFKLKNYHNYITDNETHLKVIDYTRNLTNNDFEIDLNNVALNFSRHIKYNLSTYIKALKKSHIQIRIIRPKSLDINPPHRDSYLEYYKNILNVWIPLVGCNNEASLPIIPKSHLYPENYIYRTEAKSAHINGNLYTVPCILKSTDGPLKMSRPTPKEKQALIFTPYLIHGAAINSNKDVTRVSLELRFEKK